MSVGKASADIDIEIYDIVPAQFEQLMSKIGASGVGKAFFVYKWRGLDLSLPRTETKQGSGHRGFDVAVTNDERLASRRRDFTINALMENMFTGEITDHWGGIKDLEKKRIRHIDDQRFREDSLRVLRAVQFAARFGFKIAPETVAVCRQISLDDLSRERIFLEFEKLFFASHLHIGFYYLLTLGVMEQLFERTCSKGCFFRIARELKASVGAFEPALRPYYFLYILAKGMHVPVSLFLEALGAPRHYYRALSGQKAIPKRPGERFLMALSLQYPLQNWLGHYLPGIKEKARTLGIWETPAKTGITPEILLEEGFSGKALGVELRRRQLAFLRKWHGKTHLID